MSLTNDFSFYECRQPDCRLRFPAGGVAPDGCPRCQQPVQRVAASVRLPRHRTPDAPPQLTLHLLLDNIRSLHNVGSIFRTADGSGVAHLYLAGITPTPDNARLAKTALGAETAVAWSYHANSLETAVGLKAAGHLLWAVEYTAGSTSLLAAPPPQTTLPLVLVLGNEKAGIDPALLSQCDRVLHLPMYGVKSSLNVAVVAGTAVYHLRQSHS
jgi:23S rRNA (guanosine2251-2'-O)-methyltransferase